jgi:hypothetical protein
MGWNPIPLPPRQRVNAKTTEGKTDLLSQKYHAGPMVFRRKIKGNDAFFWHLPVGADIRGIAQRTGLNSALVE